MEESLAQKLKDAGFPEVTRIGAELNLRRYQPMTPVGAPSFPYLQELLAEIDARVYLEKLAGDAWCASVDGYDPEISASWGEINEKNQGSDSYIDTRTEHSFICRTPEEAAARLYIALKEPT